MSVSHPLPDGGGVLSVSADMPAISAQLCSAIVAAADTAIARRGQFTLALSGGSLVKALAPLQVWLVLPNASFRFIALVFFFFF